MTSDYYPWNVQALVNWLSQELKIQRNSRELAEKMGLSPCVLKTWLVSPMPEITLEQICKIAQYRQWSLQQTIRWLGMKPAHVEILIRQDPASYKIYFEDNTNLAFRSANLIDRNGEQL